MPTPKPQPPAAKNPWWVVWIVNSTRAGREQPYALEQAATKDAAAQIVANAGNVILNVDGPFNSKSAAQADVTKTAKKNGTIPVNATPVVKKLTGGGLGLPNPVNDFLGRLSQASTWIRVGEAVLGLILLGVGLARITGVQNVVSQVVKARIP